MNSPNIIFRYAYPLDRGRRALYRERGLGRYPAITTVRKELEHIRKLWSRTNANNAVVNELTELTGVRITRDLEMYIFGSGLNAMSKPLMMPIVNDRGRKFTEDELIEIIIHELCHRFAGDQEETPRLGRYWTMIRQQYKLESKITQDHIIVYALLDIVSERLSTHHPVTQTETSYGRAVELVREIGAEQVLAEFRTHTDADDR